MEAEKGVDKLPWEHFDAFVGRMPMVLLDVSEVAGRRLPEKVNAFFRALYGNDFAAAAISVSDVPYRQCLVQRLAPARPNSFVFVDGLYLFLGGKPAKYHQGFNVGASIAELAVILISSGRVQHQSVRHADEILESFAPAAATFMRGRSTARPTVSNDSQDAERKAAELLGVAGDATDGEIDRAWRRVRGEYAPDKVHHVSEAFFRLAHDKVHEIDEARDVLLRRRRRTA